MAKEPLILRRLKVLSMPGLPRGLDDYGDLATHINIIAGPNASGKSSTAKAIQTLIWRQAPGDIRAEAVVELEGQHWELSVDGHRATCRRGGEEAVLSGIPSLEGRESYTLALHQMVAASDQPLAKEVIRLSSGYDLDGARVVLEYSTGVNSTRNAIYRDYISAKSRYEEALRPQVELSLRREQISILQTEKAEAEEASALLRWYGLLLDFVVADRLLKAADDEVAAFPGVLGKLSGGEEGELTSLDAQRATQLGNIQERGRQRTEANDRRTALNFPVGGLPATLLNVLENKINALSELDRNLSHCRAELQTAGAKEKTALQRLGATVDAVEWKGVSWPEVDDLEDFLQKWHQLLSMEAAKEELIQELKASSEETNYPAPADLQSGIRILTAWLGNFRASGHKNVAGLHVWILLGLTLVPVVAVLGFGKVGLLGLIVVLGYAAYVYYFSAGTGQYEADSRRADFENLGLMEPFVWDVNGVQKKLSQLVDELIASTRQGKAKDRIEVEKIQLASIRTNLAKIERRYEELKAELQLVPKAPVGEIQTFDGLY